MSKGNPSKKRVSSVGRNEKKVHVPSAVTERTTWMKKKPLGQNIYNFPRAIAERDNVVFVPDTNVLMTNPDALFGFEEHNILILWQVLLELDRGKGVEGERGANARQAIEYILSLIERVDRKSVQEGVPIVIPGSTVSNGKKMYFTYPKNDEEVKKYLDSNIPDHKILLEFLEKSRSNGKGKHILVSKDKVMRITAILLGIPVEDYFDDAIPAITHSTVSVPEDVFKESIVTAESREKRMWYQVHATSYPPVVVNSVVLVEGLKSPVLQVMEVKKGTLLMREMINYQRRPILGVTARNVEQSIALNFLLDPEITFIVIEGPAGCGKNFITLLAAFSQIFQGTYTSIVTTRDAVPVGKETGYKKGDETEKMLPWMGGMTDNITHLQELYDLYSLRSKKQEKILLGDFVSLREINSLRGRSFRKTFAILDEGQNSTREQQRLFATRHGEGSKSVCLGNFRQADRKFTLQTSGFARVISIIHGIPWAAYVVMPKVERSRETDFFEKYL